MNRKGEGIVAVVSDLMFRSKIKAVSESVGAKLIATQTLADFEESLSQQSPDLIIIDLHDRKVDPFAAIASALKFCPDIRLVAFFSHIDRAVAEKAQELGVMEILPRSKFVSALPELIAQAGRAGSQ